MFVCLWNIPCVTGTHIYNAVAIKFRSIFEIEFLSLSTKMVTARELIFTDSQSFSAVVNKIKLDIWNWSFEFEHNLS